MLCIFFVFSDSHDVTKILLEAGADPNETSDDGYPPLLVATYSNFTNIIKLLMQYDVNIHHANDMGYQVTQLCSRVSPFFLFFFFPFYVHSKLPTTVSKSYKCFCFVIRQCILRRGTGL
jgi:hypothetical protein